jgi:hypothetical protein
MLKATGDSGSVITARNRLDLLWDAGFINEILWKAIKHAFEIRNKFAHQKYCAAFSNLSETEVGRQALRFLKQEVEKEPSVELEEYYVRCWKHKINYINTNLDLLRGQIIAGISQEAERYYSHMLLSDLTSILHNHLKVYTKTKSKNSNELIDITNSIGQTISDQYEALLKRHRESDNIEEQLKVFDKRGDIEILKYIDFTLISKPSPTQPK